MDNGRHILRKMRGGKKDWWIMNDIAMCRQNQIRKKRDKPQSIYYGQRLCNDESFTLKLQQTGKMITIEYFILLILSWTWLQHSCVQLLSSNLIHETNIDLKYVGFFFINYYLSSILVLHNTKTNMVVVVSVLPSLPAFT